MISPEVALFPKCSVIKNVFLGIENTRYLMIQEKTLQERYKQLTEQTKIFIPPDVKVESLRIADQNKVEVLRTVAREARLIIMDEPTASFSSEESETLYAFINGLRDIGATIMSEILGQDWDEKEEKASEAIVLYYGAESLRYHNYMGLTTKDLSTLMSLAAFI